MKTKNIFLLGGLAIVAYLLLKNKKSNEVKPSSTQTFNATAGSKQAFSLRA